MNSGSYEGTTKTTIEIDERKLERVMRLGGFKTRKEAVDWALTEAERLTTIRKIEANPWTAEMMNEAVEPDYDVMEARRMPVRYTDVKPKRGSKGK